MIPPRRTRRITSWLAAVLVAIFFLETLCVSRIKTPAFDEPAHIAGGLSYILTDKFVVNLQHPPLLQELSGLFALVSGAHWPDSTEAHRLLAGTPDIHLQWAVGNEIIQANGPDKVTFYSRLPFALLGAFLGVLIYIWGRQTLGEVAALGALFLYVLDPTIVAHSALVGTDTGMAAFTLLLVSALWAYVHDPSFRRLLFCGLVMGLVLATKFSAPVLVPVSAVLLLAGARWQPEGAAKNLHGYIVPKQPIDSATPGPTNVNSGKKAPKRQERARKIVGSNRLRYLRAGGKGQHGASDLANADNSSVLGLQHVSATYRSFATVGLAFLSMCLVAFVLVQGLYFFSSNPLAYAHGLTLVNRDHDPNYQAYMAGHLQPWILVYFGVAYLLKEPIASIILVGIGFFVIVRTNVISRLLKLFLLLPPMILFAAYTLFADTGGIRYVIPVLPFAHLMGGFGLAKLFCDGGTWKRCLAGAFCIWMVLSAVSIFPDSLSYFNELACLAEPTRIGLSGGTNCGPLWLDDSNVDWGQGLKQLKAWMNRYGHGRTIHLAYFGTFPPQTYLGSSLETIGVPELFRDPTPGLYVVSSHFVARVPALGMALGTWDGSWLRRTSPTAIVGHCLYIFDIPEGYIGPVGGTRGHPTDFP